MIQANISIENEMNEWLKIQWRIEGKKNRDELITHILNEYKLSKQ